MRSRLAFLCLTALLACSRDSPEARIQKAFKAGVRAVEAGDASGAAAVLSPGFAGPEGMDRAGARLMLMEMLRQEKVGVTVLTQKVEVDRSQAVQVVQVLLTGRTGGALLPGEQSRKFLTIRWELRDGDWRIRELQED